MLVRYTKNKDGRAVRQAVIYTPQEHSIDPDALDPDAVRIAKRLQGEGHRAYIVGGAVRDLLIGKRPKDFDIATDAQPNRIRRLFRNSRVIGRRFRLVHIFFGTKIIEVSTFRSENSVGFQNEYGDIEEDVLRRDFTMNALFYCPLDRTIIDYVGGVDDIRHRRVRNLIPIDRIFTEDPVRMIRAVKYAATTGFRLVWPVRRAIGRSSRLLADTPYSRMTEEIFKILLSGASATIVQECIKYRLFEHMLPQFASLVVDKGFKAKLLHRLAALDSEVRDGLEDRRSRGIAYLCADYLFEHTEVGSEQRIAFTDAFTELKSVLKPIVPANKDIELALVYLIRRRKNYVKTGELELTPATERVRQEDEPYRHETDPDASPRPARRRRRRPRRPRTDSATE